jgi:purine-binding chemotaxis protein CheW
MTGKRQITEQGEQTMAKNLQFVVFHVGKELFGIGIGLVREIVRVPEITEVPDAPRFLKGVINLRGRILPVIDLRRRFGLPQAEMTKSTRVLVTENAGTAVGLLVDGVTEIRKTATETIEAPPDMVAAVGIEYITGVVKMQERLVILLDLDKVLNVEDMRKIENTVEKAMDHQAA